MTKSSPLENLEPLAKAMVPLLHVCDKTDSWFNEHTKRVERRYKELGGEITVIVNENDACFALASTTLTRAVDFILGRQSESVGRCDYLVAQVSPMRN